MNLLLYPYTKDNHFLLLGGGEHKITGVCARHRQSADQDFFGGHGLFFSSSLQESIEKVDGVLFYPDFVTLACTKKRLLDEIKMCIDNKKEVFCVMQLTKEELEMLDDGNGLFHYIAPFTDKSSLGKGEGVMRPCETPMIYIGDICEGLRTKEFTVQISNALREKGYRVCTVLDDPCAALAGCFPTPDIMYEMNYEADKIFRFHQYIQLLDRNHTPDLFVIQVPGSIYPLCQDRFSDFAMKCFYYSHAFCPDVFFCLMPANLCEKDMIAQIHEDSKVRYGYGIDAVLCRELYLDKQEAFKNGVISLMPVEHAQRQVQVLESGEDEIIVVSEEEARVEEIFCGQIEKLLVNEEEFDLL